MAKIYGAIQVDEERCKGCELCTVACPKGIIQMSEGVNRNGYHYATQPDSSACNGCTACGITCPDGCIKVYRMKE